MTQVIYDGTFEGWLTAVFEIYEFKLKDIVFTKQEPTTAFLFAATYFVVTDPEKAKRVADGLKNRLSKEGFKRIYGTFLSETAHSEDLMFRFASYVFSTTKNIEEDLSNNEVWNIRKAARITRRESHRMKAFVRFKLTKDQLYYAIIEPECDVLPVIENHFVSRYADQRWLIYDAKRKYGIYYDLEKVSTVELQFSNDLNSTKFLAEICDQEEAFFQNLWVQYFTHVNIESRKNTRLHLQHMPKRYWKNLTEKVASLKKQE
ncbi:TIGR03915 family putative DNA repair protein [Flavobacterium sp. CLA17]|uniref:TIGR03915 family putative DNA repair protein n=1 Tax=Flavobacterium sp. CLA17 TaxID=2724135 RepID=UPI001492D015|nr:TIGR03915 family putative DNA repair protein [Flavobacterium sp. CLA17]QSB28465.1 TIGR03915 family putative DNA repair protein [Flavobacterium sp. CLA17]